MRNLLSKLCLVAVALCFAAGYVCAAERETDRLLIDRWTRRSQDSVRLLSEKERADVAEFLCRLYVMSGNRRLADALVNSLPPSDDRDSAQLSLVSSLTEVEGANAALAYAQSLDGSVKNGADSAQPELSLRQRAVFHVFVTQVVKRDFRGAEKTLQFVDNPVVRSRGWYRLAQFQADAGMCEAAAKSAANIRLGGNEGREARAAIRSLIEQSKKNTKHETATHTSDYLQSLRNVAEAFSESTVNLDNLRDSEEAATKLDLSKRAIAWRQIAWAYRARGDIARARLAIGESVKANGAAVLGPNTTLNYLSLADLCIEIGDSERAKSLVEKAEITRNEEDPRLGALNSFAVVPLLVGITVRLGNVDRAMSIVERLPEGYTDSAAEAIGMLARKWGVIDKLDRDFPGIHSARIKAVLSAAVAAAAGRQSRLENAKSPISRSKND